MPKYLVALYRPDGYDPSAEDESVGHDISSLNKEMIAAGVRTFACGLGKTVSLRTQPNGELIVTDGPYVETKELVGGFWILETADLDEALMWARKGAKACRGSIEVREIFQRPAAAKD